jgi:competence protein ComEC
MLLRRGSFYLGVQGGAIVNRAMVILGFAAWIAGLYAGLFGGAGTIKLLLIAAAAGMVLPVWRRSWMVPYLWTTAMLCLSIVYGGWADQANRTGIAADDPAAGVLTGLIHSKVEVDGDRAVFVLKADQRDDTPLKPEKVRVTVRLAAREEQEIAQAWRRGMRVRVAGELSRPLPATNFGGFDYREYLRQRHIHWLMEAKGAESVTAAETDRPNADFRHAPADRLRIRLDSMAYAALNRLDAFRENLHDRVGRIYPRGQQAWMSGILFGYEDAMDPEQYRMFSDVGLAHVLAISGMNVGLILALLYGVLIRIGLTRETVLRCCFVFTPFFAAVTGAEPPVVRAGIMAMIGLELMRRRRLKDGLPICCASGWGMLVWNPYYLADISFQLSFAVTFGLLVGAPRVYRLLPPLPEQARGLLAVALTAQAMSLPLTLLYFNHFSWVSLPANLVLAPWIGSVIVPMGLLDLALSYVWLPAADWTSSITAWMNEWLFRAVSGLKRFDPYGLNAISPPIWWLGLYAGTMQLMTASWLRSRIDRDPPASPRNRLDRARFRWAAAIGALVIVCLLLVVIQPHRLQSEGIVSVLDVGQGDAILVTTPDAKHLLIDAGGTISFQKEEWRQRKDPFEVGEDVLVPLLRRRGVQQLDYLILTHGDADHIGGAEAVVKMVPVRRILMNGSLKRERNAASLYRAAAAARIPIHEMSSGTVLEIDRHSTLTVYHPPAEGDGLVERDDQNGASLVFVLQIYDSKFLFTGDIGAKEEERILAEWGSGPERERMETGSTASGGDVIADIDVLKVAHHGSRTSTTTAWLTAWTPEFAVISAGRNNRYGHPHPAVLRRLLDHDITVFQTAVNGEIRFRIGRNGMRIDTALK